MHNGFLKCKKRFIALTGVVLLLLFYMSDVFASVDLAGIMENLTGELEVIIQFLTATSYIAGLWLIASAINELRVYGQARTMTPLNTSFTGPLTRLVVGLLLFFFPGIVDISIYTFWHYGAETASTLSFVDTMGGGAWATVMDGLRVLIQTFGYASIIRGFIQMSRIGKQQAQPGAFGKSMMHIIGGVLAVNIVDSVRMIQLTLGFE